MSESHKFRAIKGVRDILPPETALWSRVEQIARDVFGSYSFQEIRLPIFEQTELFARSVGAETDIVSKEMYTFQDRDESSLTLRPEATASVVRAYIQHGMQVLPGPLKLYYMGPMFRRERPQKGRHRQFYQIGAEVLGKAVSIATDAEVIAMLMAFFETCGLGDHTLYINSIGCRDQDCRPTYLAKLRTALLKVRHSLGPDSQRRMETNPLRVLDSKIEEEQEVIERLPRITDHLCGICRQHYRDLKSILRSHAVKFEENWRLVRGLDYYTETTFEVTVPGLGAQNAICGGGRYDGLVELLGGPKFSQIKGVGFAVGEDRLVEAVADSGKLRAIRPVDVYIAWMGDTFEKAQELARLLRRNQFGVEVPTEEQKLKKSLSIASMKGATHALILGEDEIASGRLTLKRLADGEQSKLSEAELVNHLKQERDTQGAASSAPTP